MPLVRIDAMNASPEKLMHLSKAIHQALTETIGFPTNDLFQIVQSHQNPQGFLQYGDYLDIPRDENIVYVHIFLRAGRPDSSKRNFYTRAAELTQKLAGLDPKNLFIVLTENQSVDWSLGYGVAQYSPDEEKSI